MTTTAWLDDHIYAAPDCPAVDADFHQARHTLTTLSQLLDELPQTTDVNCLRHLLRAIRACWTDVNRLVWNSQTYAYNRLSRNGCDEAAKVLLSRGQQLQATLAQLIKPVTLFWLGAPEAQLRSLLQDPELFELAYAIRHDRQLQDQRLSLESEQLIEGLGVDGLHAWGHLYDSLVARLRPLVDGEPMGLAQAC